MQQKRSVALSAKARDEEIQAQDEAIACRMLMDSGLLGPYAFLSELQGHLGMRGFARNSQKRGMVGSLTLQTRGSLQSP